MAGTEVQLRLREDAWPEARAALLRRLWRAAAALPILVGVVFLGMSYLNPEADTPDLFMGSTLLPLLAVVFSVVFAVAYRKERRAWREFLLTVSELHLRRTLPGFLPAEIARGDVASVEDHAAGLLVRSRSGASLFVPRQVERFDDVRAHLEGWHSIVAAKVPAQRQLLGWGIGIAWTVGFLLLEVRVARAGWRNALLETVVLAAMGGALLAWARGQTALPIAIRRKLMLYGGVAMLLPFVQAAVFWMTAPR